MKVLSYQIKALFVEACLSAFPELSQEHLKKLVTIEEPRDKSHGDYACPAPLRLGKTTGLNPKEVGERIVDNFPKDDRIGELSFAQPGFLNLKLSKAFLEESLKSLERDFNMESNEVYEESSRPVIVEYPSTNAAKPMGVHHILTSIIGDSLANLFDFMGYKVLRINHLGDWGTNFGKIIYAVKTWGDKKKIHEKPNQEFARLYVKFNEEAEKNPALNNIARNIFAKLEKGDKEQEAIWKWIVYESTEDLKKLLKRMNIEIDLTMGESFYRKITENVIKEGIEKGLFVEGKEGSLIFDMGEGRVPALIRKKDGASLYLTRDLAAVKYRVETWNPKYIFYIVDRAQSLHFEQNFHICKALGYAQDTKLEHITFGRMSFAGKGMSTRKGNVIKLEALLNEAVDRAAKLAAKKGTELPRKEYAQLAEIMGVGSVKYAILSQDRNKDLSFEWEKIISLDGNSAPYLLYTTARARSILKKSGEEALKGLPVLTEEYEIVLVRQMIKFPEVLNRATLERKPHIICTYLYELASAFNRFYNNVHVIGANTKLQKRSRLGLIKAFLNQMESGLGILGIQNVDRM